MTEFTPFTSTLGGMLLGLASVLVLGSLGRIAGISGILGGLCDAPRHDRRWRAVFTAGLLVGGFIASSLFPARFGAPSDAPWPILIAAGLLVGFGTRLGSGCTSGHGICGLSRGSTRSFVATGSFMLAAGTTVYVIRHVVGGA